MNTKIITKMAARDEISLVAGREFRVLIVIIELKYKLPTWQTITEWRKFNVMCAMC